MHPQCLGYTLIKKRKYSPKQHHLFNRMKRLYKKWKHSGDIKIKAKYKILKLKYKSSIATSQKNYEKSLLRNKNSKKLFDYINRCSNFKSKIEKIKDSDNVVTNDPKCIANIFNRYFISVINALRPIVLKDEVSKKRT